MTNKVNFNDAAAQLAQTGRGFYQRGWVMGTSGNFSAILGREPLRICITASGNDKGALDESHFLEIDENAKVLKGTGKPSAETQIHLAIYKLKPDANSILHTHSIWGTILSDVFFEQKFIEIAGYEMLKGLAGNTTHETRERLPIVDNSQNYDELSLIVEQTLQANHSAHGVYLRAHGIYTWGNSIAEARRHIEIYEFLLEVLGRKMTLEKN